MKQNLINELWTRLSSSSPTLFKRLQQIFFVLAGVVALLIFLEPLKINLHGLEVYVNWNTFTVLIGFALGNMLPVSDPKVLDKKEPTQDAEPIQDDGTGGRPIDRNKP